MLNGDVADKPALPPYIFDDDVAENDVADNGPPPRCDILNGDVADKPALPPYIFDDDVADILSVDNILPPTILKSDSELNGLYDDEFVNLLVI